MLEGADELPVLLWKWHLAEEFEHREVCFRVYSVLFGKRFIERYVWRLVGLVTVLRHLKRWGDRVGRYMIDVDRERMNDAQRAASRRREFVCRWKMLWHLAPRILRIFLPSYHPRRDAPPSGLHAFVAHVEALYGDQETLP